MSFIKYDSSSDFSIENLPYGVFSTPSDETPRIGVAIGDMILDLKAVTKFKLFRGILTDVQDVFNQTCLNDLMTLNSMYWRETRKQVTSLLSRTNSTLQGPLFKKVFVPQSYANMHLPVRIGDYTDFYSSVYHAANVGAEFQKTPIEEHWTKTYKTKKVQDYVEKIRRKVFRHGCHLPIAYKGRANTIVVSGTQILRPFGQLNPDADRPIFGRSRIMDFELEVGFFIGGPGTKTGHRITIDKADKHIFGFVLMNDWSSRDVPKWESFPLGPYLCKNLGTTMSPWVVTLEALLPFKTSSVVEYSEMLPYLQHHDPFNFDVNLTVEIKNSRGCTTVSQTNYKYMYWTPKQQLTHHTATGKKINPGDLMASGIISGKEPGSYGSMLELTANGTRPLTLSDGTKRKFLEDGDEVIIKGFAESDSFRIGFGECSGYTSELSLQAWKFLDLGFAENYTFRIGFGECTGTLYAPSNYRFSHGQRY